MKMRKKILNHQNQEVFNELLGKNKNYENFSMKVVENTKTIDDRDEMTKEENDDFKRNKRCMKQKKKFPTYKDEFNNFNKIQVMESLQHSRNIIKYLVF